MLNSNNDSSNFIKAITGKLRMNHIGPNIIKITNFLLSSNGTIKDRTIRSGIWITISSGCIRILELIRTIVLARLLVPELFGIMSIVLFVRGTIDVLTNTSFKTALIYRQNDIDKAANTAWTLNILRGILLFIIMFAVAPFIAIFYKESAINTSIRFIAFALLVESFTNIHTVIYEKNIDYKLITISRSICSITNISVVILLAWLYRNIWALLIGSFMSSCLNVIISYIIQKQKPRFYFDKTIALDLFHYGKFVTGAGILIYLTLNITDVALGKILDLKQLGYYSYAFTIANLPSTHITSVISEIIFPAYNAIKLDVGKLRHAFLKIFRVISIVSIPAAFGIMALSSEIVIIILGEKWTPSIAPLRILIFFGLVRSLSATTGPVLIAIGKPNVVFWIVLAKFGLIIVLLYPCILNWGTVGAAFALTIPMVIEQFFLWYIIKKAISIDLMPFIHVTIKASLISALMFIMIEVSKHIYQVSSFNVLFINVILGLITYIVLTITFNKNISNELI